MDKIEGLGKLVIDKTNMVCIDAEAAASLAKTVDSSEAQFLNVRYHYTNTLYWRRLTHIPCQTKT